MSALTPAQARAALQCASAPAAGGSRCLVMGIVNVTPDSFSDGGRYLNVDAALAHAQALVAAGADIVDVGGQSTRPGAGDVDPAEEWRRIGPVVGALVGRGAVVSVDTMWAATARRALDAGAHIINDVSGGLADAAMAEVVASSDALYVAMHWRGHAGVMDAMARYADVTKEVCAHLAGRARALEGAGLSPERLILDPGLGFAKNAQHNWELLRHLGQVMELGYPVLVGASRKRFLADVSGPDAAASQRDDATTAVTALVAARGAWAVRVHNAAASAAAVRVAQRMG